MYLTKEKTAKPNIFGVLKPYTGQITLLIFFALISNVINLLIPKIIQNGIDDYTQGHWDFRQIILWFALAVVSIFIFTWGQTIIQTFASERVARDIRRNLAGKIAQQNYAFVQEQTPAKLLTNLTSDVDAVKAFVAQAIVSIISSIFLIIGATILLLNINWRLGLVVLTIIPLIGLSFMVIFKKVKKLFKRTQEVIDWLNKVINESILGAGLIRVLNAQFTEYNKFMDANMEAKNLGLSILKLFATLIPIIVLTSNFAVLAVLLLGGQYVINDTMTLGEFAAFNSYIAILIFPILIIGFMSNVIARATASYGRIHGILDAPAYEDKGTVVTPLKGNIAMKDVSVFYGSAPALKNISFEIKAGTRNAILGPTAAGKTQILYLLATLITPDTGEVLYDNIPLQQYKQNELLKQIGLVFQDSILFNASIRNNIAMNAAITDTDIKMAIQTAELNDFIDSLPDGLDTIISERGTSLSGGQKQRIMLARALASNPTILLLDDFTARVDSVTSKKISNALEKNYDQTTILSVTQKIEAIKDYDQIILLMEGEIIDRGTHEYLLKNCMEYVQIFNSQKSTLNIESES